MILAMHLSPESLALALLVFVALLRFVAGVVAKRAPGSIADRVLAFLLRALPDVVGAMSLAPSSAALVSGQNTEALAKEAYLVYAGLRQGGEAVPWETLPGTQKAAWLATIEAIK